MKINQTHILIAGFIAIASMFSALLLPSSQAAAYKCVGTTNGGTHSYRNGGCYMGSQLVAGEKPVKNDGTPITEWECASGTYNATKGVCERCTGTSCQTVAATPLPKGGDTTTAPTNNQGGGNSDSTDPDNEPGLAESSQGECAGIKTDYFACEGDGIEAFGGIISIIIAIVSIGVGIVAVGGLVYGAVLYASAQDNQEQVKKAITIVRSVIIGLILYVFMFTIANWLVPGGIIGGGTPDSSTPATQQPQTSGQNNSTGS